MKKKNDYYTHFLKFMAWKLKKTELELSTELNGGIPELSVLLSIDADEVAAYFNLKAYGTEHPHPDTPPICRSSTLEYLKKSLSFYMPRKAQRWDDIRQDGNPTRSDIINSIIKGVNTQQVRKNGVKSKSMRPLDHDEFLSLLIVNLKNNTTTLRTTWLKLLCHSIWTLQFHIIGRCDDMVNLKIRDIKGHDIHEFALVIQMVWSKNILEERDSPSQIILGSTDERLCPILSLAVYLGLMCIERNVSRLDSSCSLFMGYGGKNGLETSRLQTSTIRKHLKDCLSKYYEINTSNYIHCNIVLYK